MAESRNKKPAATLGERMKTAIVKTVVKPLVKTAEKTGFREPRAYIHNKSDKPILLIPISDDDPLPDGDPATLSDGKVLKNLAKSIPAGDSLEVVRSKYDHSQENPDAQIYIHFRVGDNDKDDAKKFPENLPDKYPKGFAKRDLLLHSQLKDNMSLKCHEGKVIVIKDVEEDGNAGQADPALPREGTVTEADGGQQKQAKPALPKGRMVTEPDGGQQQQADLAMPKEETVTGPGGGQQQADPALPKKGTVAGPNGGQQQADPAMPKEETVTGPGGGQQDGTNSV